MLIGKAMRPAPGHCSPGGLLAEALPISGQIDPKTFPFLLTNLHRQGATGSFKVEGPLYQKALYFRGGRILFGSSNDPRDQLGAILIENGKISPEQLDDVNSKVGPGSPLAKVLAETGFVNQRELSEAARTKVESILSDIIGYGSGNFEFEDGVLPKGAVDLKLSTESLVLSAVRRIQDRNFVLRHLSGLSVVLLPTLESEDKLAEIPPEGAGLLAQLDGIATLKDAAERTRLDEFEAAKVACALLFLGLVERLAPRKEPPVFMLDDEGAGDLDLSETARAAFLIEEDEAAARHAAAPQAPPTNEKSSPQPHETVAPFDISLAPQPVPAMIASHLRSSLEAAALDTTPAQPKAMISAVPESPSSNHSLAAVLDVILDGKNQEGPLEPLERRELVWSARREQPAISSPRSGKSHRTLWMSVGGVGAAAVLALGGWFFFLRQAPSRPPVASQPSPRPVVASAMSALPTPSTVAAAPASLPPTAPPSAPPSTAPSPPPAPPTPAPRSAGPEAAGSLDKARQLLRGGSYPEAASTFATNVKKAPRGALTVQLFVACAPETVQKAVDAVNSDELYILPASYQGRSCFRLCWGLYSQESRASAAAKTLPEYFRKGGASPRIVPASSLLP